MTCKTGLIRFGLAAALLSCAHLAMAQNPNAPAVVTVPPLPAEAASLGNLDAGCFLATINMGASARQQQDKIPADKREATLEVAMRQLAFYGGKATASLGQKAAEEAAKFAAGAYFNEAKFADPAPTMQWCLRNYVDLSNRDFVGRMDQAVNIIGRGSSANSPAIKAEELDRDALCLLMISVALPSTMAAAKKDPRASKSVYSLRRGQHFYMGRTYGQSDQSAVTAKLAMAYRFSGQLQRTKDTKTGYVLTMSCLTEYRSAMDALLSASAEGLPFRK